MPQGKILREALPLRPEAAKVLINQLKNYPVINHSGKECEKECVTCN